MPKTILTAETFEEAVVKLQAKCDRVVMKVNTALMNKVNALHAQLDDDQKERVRRRLMARIREQQRPKIISPGSARFN